MPDNHVARSPLVNCLLNLIIACGLFYLVASWLCNHPAPKPAPSLSDKKIEAWCAAEQFVKARLVSPGSADFGSAFHDWQDPIAQTQDMRDGSYQCAGWVDSQNRFGALIRSQFICVVRPQAGSYICDYCEVW